MLLLFSMQSGIDAVS